MAETFSQGALLFNTTSRVKLTRRRSLSLAARLSIRLSRQLAEVQSCAALAAAAARSIDLMQPDGHQSWRAAEPSIKMSESLPIDQTELCMKLCAPAALSNGL